MTPKQKSERESALLSSIVANLDKLEKLQVTAANEWVSEDLIYRFYHQSFKVYALQHETLAIVDALKSLAADLPLNHWFMEIVVEGTGKEFTLADNEHWLKSTRPILEAFFHAMYFLEMVCKYGKELKEPPKMLPSGWAAVLYLYNLR